MKLCKTCIPSPTLVLGPAKPQEEEARVPLTTSGAPPVFLNQREAQVSGAHQVSDAHLDYFAPNRYKKV
jgi:hypothetical protein